MICFIKYLRLIFIFFCWNIKLILTSSGATTSPVPGAPKTGTVSPNSPIQNPTTDAQKKQAYYIANAQGYCLEFRLSENTVTNFEEYKAEVARIAGMTWDQLVTAETNGTYSGWLPLKDFLVKEGFTCTWADWQWPVKEGEKQIIKAIQDKLAGEGWQKIIGGTLQGKAEKDHSGSTVFPCLQGEAAWYVYWLSGNPGPHEVLWYDTYILLVRPL